MKRSHALRKHNYMNTPLENNPIRHMLKIKTQMCQIINHLRDDLGEVTEAKAQALFETAAEVLVGLVKDFDDYEQNSKRRGKLNAGRPSRKLEPSVTQGN